MEDYTYDLDPAGPRVLGAHMLEVCPSLAAGRPSCEIHPLSIGGRSDPVRLVFDAAPGPAVVAGLTDMGDRFRIVANVVDVVATEEALPRLPVARAVWRPRPDFRTTVEAWLTAGGAHHTVLSRALDPEPLVDFAEMAGIELILIDETSTLRDVQERDPLEPGLLPPGPWRLGCRMSRDRAAALREPSGGRTRISSRRASSAVRSAMPAGSTGNAGIILIKPSGVPYAELRPEHLVAVALDDGRVVDGDLRPSSDTPTHLRSTVASRRSVASSIPTRWRQPRGRRPAGRSRPSGRPMPTISVAPSRSPGSSRMPRSPASTSLRRGS